MLLTLKPPLHNDLPSPHEYPGWSASPPHRRNSTSRATRDPFRIASPPLAPSASSMSSTVSDRAMDTPHRNLPPPIPTTLPPGDRGLATMAPMAPLTPMPQLPAPPPQWQNADESMRQWLQTKAEEDRRKQEEERRKQEEERTRQESLKLDQLKIGQTMLRDSLQAGVPPHMVPLIFAAIRGTNESSASTLELAQYYVSQMNPTSTHHHQQPPSQQTPLPHQVQHQQYASQPPPLSSPQPQQQQQQQQQQTTPSSQLLTPEIPRDNRTIPPNPYAAQPATRLAAPAQPTPAPPAPNSFGRGLSLRPSSYSAEPPTQGSTPLSLINTAEMHIHHPPTNTGVPQFSAPQPATAPPPVKQETVQLLQPQQQQPPPAQQQPQSSPFIHWVPPNQSQPNTPSGKSPNHSPYSAQPGSHLRSEYQNSPKKRKAPGPHHPAPPPTSQFSELPSSVPQPSPGRTPPGGAGRRGASHLRHRSDTSSHNESRLRDLLEPGQPAKQIHVHSLVGNAELGSDRTGRRRSSNSDREQSKREKGCGDRYGNGNNDNSNGNSNRGGPPSGDRSKGISVDSGEHPANGQPGQKPNLMNPYGSGYPRNRDGVDSAQLEVPNANAKGSIDLGNDHLSTRDNTIRGSTSI